MLKINNLNKFYGSFQALNNLCLEIPMGSIYGFVGPNGAGKTTTMKIMAGLLKADSGEIYIDDVNILNNRNFICEKIGYMPDFFGVYDNLRVEEYLDFYADAYYLPEEGRAEKFSELLDLVNLSDKKDFYVDDLSRGMKQRLCLGRSIIHDPQVLILDEPASGLDPRARIEMKDVLKKLNEIGKTIIISSHILPELAEMCTYIGIMENGKMITATDVEKTKESNEIEIKVIENPQVLVQFLDKREDISNIHIKDNAVAMHFSGDDMDLSELLSSIIAQKIPVIGFDKKETTLEETFLKVTGGADND